MTVNLTDNDNFPANVRAPDDGDPANGATFQAGLQDLADRTRNHKNRLDALSGRALYTIDTGAQVAPVDLTLIAASSGITLVGGNAVELPEGSWWVAARPLATSDSTGNPVHFTATLKVGDGTLVVDRRTRYSANASTEVQLDPAAPVTITDPAAQRISLEVAASAGTVELATLGGLVYLSIHRIPAIS